MTESKTPREKHNILTFSVKLWLETEKQRVDPGIIPASLFKRLEEEEVSKELFRSLKNNRIHESEKCVSEWKRKIETELFFQE